MSDLMTPRYKVIADYPGQLFKMGDIVSGESAYVIGDNETWSEKVYLKDYPAIFKPMVWWEDRKIADMPEYLQIKGGSGGYIVKVKKHFQRYEIGWQYEIETPVYFISDDLSYCSDLYNRYQPSTESEYLAYKQSLTGSIKKGVGNE